MLIPKGAVDALQLKSYMKKNEITPLKVYETSQYNKKNELWVYTFQCGFKTERELEYFKKLCKIMNIGILENK